MAAHLNESSEVAEGIYIMPDLVIPAGEVHFRFSRSSGPGGQHVNRSETRVELLFGVSTSPSLTDKQRARLLARLASRIDGEGVLRIVASGTRSQADNRAAAVARFRALLLTALQPQKYRVPTHPTASSHERRLREKRTRSATKVAREKGFRVDDE